MCYKNIFLECQSQENIVKYKRLQRYIFFTSFFRNAQKKGDPCGSPIKYPSAYGPPPFPSFGGVPEGRGGKGVPEGRGGDYRFTNVLVTEPASVLTRTKYMPSARPETLMRVVCRDAPWHVSTTVRTTLP